MRAVGYRVVRLLRGQWRSTVALALVSTVVIGVVLAFTAGARRTGTAPDRYTAAFATKAEGRVEQQDGLPRTDEVAALPGVSSVDAVTFVFGGLMPADGGPPLETLVFAGSHVAFGTRLEAGRLPDPRRPGEFVATRTFTELNQAALGDRFRLVTLAQAQADRSGFGAFFEEEPEGPSMEAVLVGVVDGPTELQDPTPLTAFSLSLLDSGDVAVSASVMAVRLRPGIDRSHLRTQLDSLPDGQSLGLEPFELIPSEVVTAVEGQSRGLWVLAGVAAVAGVVVLGQLVVRSVRLPPEESRRLAAVGYARGQVVAESMGRASVPVLAGTALGMVVATAMSGIFPSGFVRRLEPSPGLEVNAGLLLGAAGALILAILVWVLLFLILAGQPPAAVRPAGLVEAAAARCRSAPAATGLRFAFTRAQLDRGSVRGAVVGMLAISALLLGVVVFGTSLNRLVADGARFGYTFDLASGTGGDSVPQELRTGLSDDGDVQAVTLFAAAEVRAGALTLGLAAMERLKGEELPVVLSGRLPSSDEEIAPGRLAADALGVDVGDGVDLAGEGPPRRYRVTGIAVVPGVEGLDGVGEDAVVTLGGLRRLVPEAEPSVAAVRVRPGTEAAVGQRYELGQLDLPIVIRSLARLRPFPAILAGVLGALALMTVVHVMVTSARNRRRDIALLRSLGADGGWITRVVHWQATTFVLVTLLLGAPLGLAAGRIVFELYAHNVGAVPDASYPVLLLGAGLAAFVVVGNLIAAGPARRARRLSPAPQLAAE